MELGWHGNRGVRRGAQERSGGKRSRGARRGGDGTQQSCSDGITFQSRGVDVVQRGEEGTEEIEKEKKMRVRNGLCFLTGGAGHMVNVF